jgi:hypothetical protein
VCPRPGITARSAPIASPSASQTASKAGEWLPEITSFAKDAFASASSGMALPRGTLAREQLDAPRQWLRELVGRLAGRPGAGAEVSEEDLGRDPVGIAEQQLAVSDHLVDDRDPRGQPERARLRDAKRSDSLGSQRGREQRDHASVGVPDEMCSAAEQLGEERCLHLEVATLERGAPGEPRPVRDDQPPAVGELELPAPGQVGADHAAVDEEDRRSVPQAENLQIGRADHGQTLRSAR